MADKPLPDDRAALAAIEKIKIYNAYKARQLQKPPSEGPGGADTNLTTVETWAADVEDNGKAWGEQKSKEANQKIIEADAWAEVVKRDEKDAAMEADFRGKLDVDKAKEELKKKLDDYADAMQGLADAGEPGFKGKAVQTKKETAEAKKFIDERMEKALDDAAARNAEQRKARKATAEAMMKRGEEGRKWKAEYGDDPARWPEGQRADVQAALDSLHEMANQIAEELSPFGARVAPHRERLAKMQAWTEKLKPQVTASGPALKSAKQLGASGSAESRATLANIEAFQQSLEAEASENIEVFRLWTDENNRLAAQWINSDSPKHRQWAQEWMQTQAH